MLFFRGQNQHFNVIQKKVKHRKSKKIEIAKIWFHFPKIPKKNEIYIIIYIYPFWKYSATHEIFSIDDLTSSFVAFTGTENTILLKGKVKRFKGVLGRRSNTKKAIVTLAPGNTIDLSAGV